MAHPIAISSERYRPRILKPDPRGNIKLRTFGSKVWRSNHSTTTNPKIWAVARVQYLRGNSILEATVFTRRHYLGGNNICKAISIWEETVFGRKHLKLSTILIIQLRSEACQTSLNWAWDKSDFPVSEKSDPERSRHASATWSVPFWLRDLVGNEFSPYFCPATVQN